MKTETFNLQKTSLRTLNDRLHHLDLSKDPTHFIVEAPRGTHNIACGLNNEITVDIQGHAGYYCGGMNQTAAITIQGNCGVGVAENMMSGMVCVKGSASQSAGATGNGGLLVIHGNASARCGISMKGIDIVVRGSVGHLSAFMAQSGNLVVCGDSGDSLGDSIYEAKIFVLGKAKSLGADCIEKEMHPEHIETVTALLKQAGIDDVNPAAFKRYGSARKLYNFNIDHADKY